MSDELLIRRAPKWAKRAVVVRATGKVIGCVQQHMADGLWYAYEVAEEGGFIEDASSRGETMRDAAEELLYLQ